MKNVDLKKELVGTKLKQKKNYDFDGSAEVCRYNSKTDKYYVVVEENFGAWFTYEEMARNFIIVWDVVPKE